MAQAEACWDYIESGADASEKRHRNVYSRIQNYSFFLSEEMGDMEREDQ